GSTRFLRRNGSCPAGQPQEFTTGGKRPPQGPLLFVLGGRRVVGSRKGELDWLLPTHLPDGSRLWAHLRGTGNGLTPNSVLPECQADIAVLAAYFFLPFLSFLLVSFLFEASTLLP